MKVTVIKRLGGFESGTEPFCDVWVGATRELAVKKAVECMYAWWHDRCVENGEEPDAATNEEIFDAYVDFWSEEEQITVEEEEI